jgi:hypothetical protein
MFPDYSSTLYIDDRLPRPDRRPSPRAAEIRLRVRRLTNHAGA